MWWKIFLSNLVIVAALGLAPAVWAAEPVVHDVPTQYWYPQTFDNLMLDFTVYPTGSATKLKTMTVALQGTARPGVEVTAIRLWRDGGAAGWQGYGADTVVAAAIEFDAGTSRWVMAPTDLTIAPAGQRLFITADTASYIYSQRTLQGYIPSFLDSNGDGQYQTGDTGIFWDGGVASHAQLSNPALHVIKETRIDLLAPDVWFTSVTDSQTLTGASFTLTGKARDQGLAQQVSEVKIGIVKSTEASSAMQWSAVTTSNSYMDWQYTWVPAAPGNYTLQLQARDTAGNTTIDEPMIMVTVVAPSAPAPIEVLPTLADGSLVKTADSAQVWVISDGYRRWVTSGEVFEGLGYAWSEIQTVSAATLAAYPVGDALTVTYRHPNGALIKYQTYPEVFLLEQGKRRHIANEATFLGLGYRWSSIVTVPDWEQYPDGAAIRQS